MADGELAAIFAGDAFKMESLTQAINKIPHVPTRVGELGIFKPKGIKTTTAIIEERAGVLTILNTAPRGAPGQYYTSPKRKARNFTVPHIPYDDMITADDVLSVRAFGETSRMKGIQEEVADHLRDMKLNHDLTAEFHRVKSLQGILYDGDGVTVLYNWFTEFGITQAVVDFVLGTTTTNIRAKCLEVSRLIKLALGMIQYKYIHALCGRTFFGNFVDHDHVRTAYERWNSGEFLRSDPRAGFSFAGITFEQYEGTVNGQDFIPAGDARFFPVGAPEVFQTNYAPANFMETVGTKGLPLYARQALMKHNIGVELHTQSNPLNICARPEALVRGHSSN